MIRADDTRNLARFLTASRSWFFAESRATYVAPKQAYDACTTGSWATVKDESMTIYYALTNNVVKVDSPVAIGAADTTQLPDAKEKS